MEHVKKACLAAARVLARPSVAVEQLGPEKKARLAVPGGELLHLVRTLHEASSRLYESREHTVRASRAALAPYARVASAWCPPHTHSLAPSSLHILARTLTHIRTHTHTHHSLPFFSAG